MISYQDRTFCGHSGVCANYECNRWVDFEKAKDSGLPVALAILRLMIVDISQTRFGRIWLKGLKENRND